MVVALNLLWPTSAPLRANGVPLNKYPEFALAAIFLGWLGLLLAFAVLRRIDPAAVPPQRFRWVDRCLTGSALLLGALLLLVRVAAPPEESFKACYSTPESPNVPCLFFADGWAPTAAGRVSQVSRLEEQLVFDARDGYYPWRLGAFNKLFFNVFEPRPYDTRGARREIFRRTASHPFAVTFAWDTLTGDRLARLYPSGAQMQIVYLGEAALVTESETRVLPFRRKERVEVIDLRPAELQSLRLRYANYSCPDVACLNYLTMDPIPFAEAVFRVSLALPGASADQAVPVTQRLLAQAEPPLSPFRLGPRIELAFVLVALARLAAWIGRLSLARRPSIGLVAGTALLASALAGLFPPGATPDPTVTVLGPQLGFLPIAFLALPAFLGAVGLFAAVRLLRARGYPLHATMPGRLLLVSCVLLAPLVIVGAMLICARLGSLATGSLLGSLPNVPKSEAAFMSLSFVLMTLPVVLAAAGVLVAVVIPRSWAVGTIAPVMLVLASAGLLMQLPTAASMAAPVGPVSATEFFDVAGVDPAAWRLPPRDDIELYSAGDDPLTYASWAKDVLRAPQRFTHPTTVLSKPWFMYFRAARYALLGDGEIYALAQSRAFIVWVVSVGGVLVLAAIGTARGVPADLGVRSRTGLGLLAVLSAAAWLWLSYSVATPTLPDLVLKLSEGPATTAVLMSFGVLVGARGRSHRLLVVAGALFGLSVLYRTSNLPLALLGLTVVWLGSDRGISGGIRASAAYILPIVVAVLLIWLHAGAPLGVPPEIARYVAFNRDDASTPPGSYFQGLVPSVSALQITCAALFAVVVALIMPGTISTRSRVAALGLAVLFGALVPLLPQRGAPFYPRTLLAAYFTIAFVPIALLISCCSGMNESLRQHQR